MNIKRKPKQSWPSK